MKPNYETIYLLPTDYDGGQLTYSWCDCPAPGEGMDPADAIKYVRADLVPDSNELLARRIVELTETVTALRNQLAAKPSDSGYAKLQKQVSEQSKVIEHVAATVGCEDDPMSCWESVEALKAQVEQLRDAAEKLTFEIAHDPVEPDFKSFGDLMDALAATPAQCLSARDAEIKAQAVDAEYKDLLHIVANQYDGNDSREWSIGANHVFVLFSKEVNKRVNQLRQQAKGGN